MDLSASHDLSLLLTEEQEVHDVALFAGIEQKSMTSRTEQRPDEETQVHGFYRLLYYK